MTTPIVISASQPSKMIPAIQNKKNFWNHTRETCILRIMAKLAFSCQKSIPTTLSKVAERTLAGPSASVSRLNNFLLIRLFPVFLIWFQIFWMFLVACIIFTSLDVELKHAHFFVIIPSEIALCGAKNSSRRCSSFKSIGSWISKVPFFRW